MTVMKAYTTDELLRLLIGQLRRLGMTGTDDSFQQTTLAEVDYLEKLQNEFLQHRISHEFSFKVTMKTTIFLKARDFVANAKPDA